MEDTMITKDLILETACSAFTQAVGTEAGDPKECILDDATTNNEIAEIVNQKLGIHEWPKLNESLATYIGRLEVALLSDKTDDT